MLPRHATVHDLPAILDIYNDVICSSTAVYTDKPVALAERRSWYEARAAQGYPILVAEEAGVVAGFASFGDWRAWPCYRFTIEHSVHVRADLRGKGYGRSLLLSLVNIASAMEKHIMIGGIDAANVASIRFHERLGFEKVAHFSEVGFKFGRWLDLIFMQRRLSKDQRR